MLTRRAVLRAGGTAIAAAIGVGYYTWQVEPHWVEIVRRALPIKGLPPALAGRLLAQISDIHVGFVDPGYVLDTFRRVSELRPDIVVLTGDFIGYHDIALFNHLPDVYRHVPKGRLATIATLGNHDYGLSWIDGPASDRVVQMLMPFGVLTLRNDVCEVEGLQIAGLDDLWAHRFTTRPLSRLDSRRAAIVLSHNPDTVDLPGWEGYEGWILAGHTHGGQCKPPFLPPPLLPVANKHYTAGEFTLPGNRRMYINRGLGHTLQVRFNVRPEVTIFELRSA